MNIHYCNIIHSPIHSEKSTLLSDKYKKKVFKVALEATKKQIKNSIEKIFEVEVIAVNIINVKGKEKKFKGIKGRRKRIKKAIVTFNANTDLESVFGGNE